MTGASPPAFVKICGITRVEDAQIAVRHGATALGFVFWAPSPRNVTPEQARAIVETLPAGVTAVAVFVNETPGTMAAVVGRSGVHAVQLHGDEAPEAARDLPTGVLRSVDLAHADAIDAAWPEPAILLLDAFDRERRGGTGRTVDWARAAALARRRRVVLAGGLTPETVAEAIATVRPFGVDVSSGVEAAPGIKDEGRVARFLERARAAFEAVAGAPVAAGGVAERDSHGR